MSEENVGYLSIITSEENVGVEPEKASLIEETNSHKMDLINIVTEPMVGDTNDNSIIKTETEFQGLLSKIFQNKKLCDEFDADILPKFNMNTDMSGIVYHLEKIVNDTDLYDIYKYILEIVKDGKIDSKDIPQFIILVEKIHKFTINYKDGNFSLESKIKLTAIFIKFIFRGLIEKGIIGNLERKSELIKEIDPLVDVCIRLLNFQIDIQPINDSSNFFDKLKFCFSCKM